MLDGNICALLAAKDHVNVFLYDGAIVPDPEGIITGGHDNETARTVAIREGEPINAPRCSAMFRQIIANNRAGGWRKLKDSPTIDASTPPRAPESSPFTRPLSTPTIVQAPDHRRSPHGLRRRGASADPLSQGHDDPLWPAHVGHAPDVLVLTDAADQAVAVRSQPVDRRLQVVDFE